MSAYDEYSKLVERIENEDFDNESYFQIKDRVSSLASFSSEEQTRKILQHALELDSYQPCKKWVLSALPNMYAKHPALRQEILKTLNNEYFDKHLDIFYPVAVQITLYASSYAQNSDDRETCLDKINLRVNSKENTPSSLKSAFREMGRLVGADIPNKSYISRIIKSAMGNPQNDEESISQAEHILDVKGNLKSNAFICERSAKTSDVPFGIRQTQQIDVETPCVFVLPGDATVSEKELNGYLSDISAFMVQNNLDRTVKVYGAFYDFGEYMNRELAIIKQMEKYHRLRRRSINMEQENINPKYIDVLFDKLLLPRIADEKGKKRNIKDAQRYIRNINFFAHCHGGYVFLKLEEKLEEKMLSLGYTDVERKQIFDNLFCTAFAPFAPMGASKSQMVSFVSADDDVIRQYNNAEFHIRNMAKEGSFQLGYLPKKQGNCFIVSEMSANSNSHNFSGFEKKRGNLTYQGFILMDIMKSTLLSAVRSSIENTELPSIRVLAQNKFVNFEILEENGRQMWQQILQQTKDAAAQKRLLHNMRRTKGFDSY